MKFTTTFIVLAFCFFHLHVAAQSDPQLSEYSRIYSNIISYNSTDSERIKSIEKYIPAVFFQKKGYSALSSAMGTKSLQFVEYILSKPGVNAAETGYSKESILVNLPWEYYKIIKPGTCVQIDTLAATRKQMALLLISKGASIYPPADANTNNVMGMAVYNKDLDFLQFLYEKNGNKLVPNLLQPACAISCLDIVTWLIDHGENVNEPNKNEGSAIGSSVRNPAIVRYLISKGANVNLANSYGWTPLMYAANYGNIESLQLLLDAGADINAVNVKGWNALQVAKEYKQKEVIKLLTKLMKQ